MSPAGPLSAENSSQEKLPRRDWILMPGLCLLTICIVAASTELIARQILPAKGGMKECLVWEDRVTGVRGIPNCVCREKIPEGQAVEYRFNSCGHYTALECGAKSPGVYRIVMTGASFPTGLGVPRERTFAALLPEELSRRTGRKVELYNESLPRKSAHAVDLQFADLLAAKPDLILWVLNYSDVQIASLVAPSDYVAEHASGAAGKQTSSNLRRLREKAEAALSGFAHAVNDSWRETRTYVMLMDLMAATESQKNFLKRNRTSESQYLDAQPSQARLDHLKEFDVYAADIEKRAQAAGVTLVAVFVPTRLLAAMISEGEWPPDIDPFSLDKQLKAIIVKHGGTYVDILPDFRDIPDAAQGFFAADVHFNPQGHLTIAGILARELTSGAVPALSASRNSQ